MSYQLTAAQRKRQAALVEQINALPESDDMTVYGPLVVAMFKGVPFVVWRVIDDGIGNGSRLYTKGYLVRRVRNDRAYGSQLFDALGR